MKFKSKNLNIFKPTTLSAIFVILAAASLFSTNYLDYAITTVMGLRVTPMFVIGLLLSVGILMDAKK